MTNVTIYANPRRCRLVSLFVLMNHSSPMKNPPWVSHWARNKQVIIREDFESDESWFRSKECSKCKCQHDWARAKIEKQKFFCGNFKPKTYSSCLLCCSCV